MKIAQKADPQALELCGQALESNIKSAELDLVRLNKTSVSGKAAGCCGKHEPATRPPGRCSAVALAGNDVSLLRHARNEAKLTLSLEEACGWGYSTVTPSRLRRC